MACPETGQTSLQIDCLVLSLVEKCLNCPNQPTLLKAWFHMVLTVSTLQDVT